MCTSCGEEHPAGTTACPRTGAPVTGGPCGTVIDRYRVERWIGSGGAGSVYSGRHTMIGQPVAIKLLRPGLERDAEAVARFRREAQAAASIGHPRIPRILDLGVAPDGRPFLVMDLLEGRDLRALLEAEAPLAPARAVAMVVQILEGLEAAHRVGIVHRDIKPANVFVTLGPERGERISLLDFGLSRMTEPMRTGALTALGAVIGTPFYMSPEQAAGAADVDFRADLYSTAVLLYQMLSRALPFPGDSVESVLVRIASSPPVPLVQVAPGTPPSLLSIVERGMAREPAARFPSAQDFARALRDAPLQAAAPATRAMTSPTPEAPPVAAWPQAPVVTTPPTPIPPSTHAAPVAHAAPPAKTSRVLLLVAALVLAPLVLLMLFGAVVAIVRFSTQAPAPQTLSGPSVPPAIAPPTAPPPTTRALSGPENPPDAVQAAMAATPVPAAPAPELKRPVTVGMAVLEGPVSDPEVRQLLGRVRTTLDVCRPTGAAQRVRLRLMVDAGGALARAPYAGNEADVVVSSCVASRFEAQRLPASPSSGSFRVEVGLAPR